MVVLKRRPIIVSTRHVYGHGISLTDAGVGARHPASGGQFWPPEKNRKWPEVGIRIFYHFFSKTMSNFIILINDMCFEAPGNHFLLSNSHD
jgi:hypothetical protein